MSETPSVPVTHRVTVTIEDGKVRLKPWMKTVHPGDSIVWSFRGPVDPDRKPVVTFEPLTPGVSKAPFDEIALLAGNSKVQGQNARGGHFKCRYGYEGESGVELLDFVPHRRTPGIQVMPSPPDRSSMPPTLKSL